MSITNDVRSPLSELCPQLLVLRPNFIKYIGKAKEIRAIMSEYDDQMEASSIDEAHLNLTDYCAVTGRDVEDVVNEMRARILEETKISVSAGIAPNDTIAKIASNTNKPNGQFVSIQSFPGSRTKANSLKACWKLSRSLHGLHGYPPLPQGHRYRPCIRTST